MRLELGKEVAVIKVMRAWTKVFSCEDENAEIILKIYPSLSECFCMLECEGLERI